MTTIFSNTVDDLSSPILDGRARIERRQTQDEGRRAGDHLDGGGGPTVDWTWTHLAGILAVLAFVFTLGANWHRIDALSDKFDTHVRQNDMDHATFANQKAMDQHFDNLQHQIEDLKAYLVRQDIVRHR